MGYFAIMASNMSSHNCDIHNYLVPEAGSASMSKLRAGVSCFAKVSANFRGNGCRMQMACASVLDAEFPPEGSQASATPDFPRTISAYMPFDAHFDVRTCNTRSSPT